MKLKKLRQSLKKSTLSLLICSLSLSCAQVKIKDTVWYGDLGPEGAIEFHTHRPEIRDLTKEEWDAKRMGMVCTTTNTFAEWKKNILKLCTENPRCRVDEVILYLKNFEERVELLP